MKQIRIIALTALILLSFSPQAWARGDGFRADVELDPIAYALRGYSLHVGMGWERVRVDLGAFALDVPEVFHGNEGYEQSMHGVGAKLDLFYNPMQRGPFVGLEVSWLSTQIIAQGDVVLGDRVTGGVRAGWRLALPHGFFVAPWVGVGYAPGVGTQRVGEGAFEESPWTIFPTVHVGYRL